MAAAKFLFDNDFGRSGNSAGHAPAVEAALKEAEARGHRAGQAAARAEAAAESARSLAAATASFAMLANGLKAIEQRLEAEAVEVAVAVAGKLAAELMRREPFAEIEALAADCFRNLVGVPHVAVRVHSALYEEARTKFESAATAAGFAGRVVVLGEPEIAAGDCRIEWADGGAIRDRAAIEAAIGEAVERYLEVRREAADGPAQ